MKVVSLWQPHASLVVCNINGIAEKRMETRHFGMEKLPMRSGERVYIHAALKWDEQLWALSRTSIFAEALSRHGISLPLHWQSAAKSRGDLPFGCIVGEVDWLDACQVIGVNENGLPRLSMSQVRCVDYNILMNGQEQAFGNYDLQRYAHVLSNPKRYDEPIPLKGRQEIGWNWDKGPNR